MSEAEPHAHAFLGVHHVQLAIPAGGEEESRAFWSEVLGFDEIEKPAALAARGGCWFRAGAVEIHLGVDLEYRPSRKGHPGILVRGLRHLAQRLEAHGVVVTWDAGFPGFDRFYASDRFGNRLEFLEPASDR